MSVNTKFLLWIHLDWFSVLSVLQLLVEVETGELYCWRLLSGELHPVQ